MKKKSSGAGRRVRNPFYAQVQRGGIRIVAPIQPLTHRRHEVSNPYYERVRQAGGVVLPTRRGRPRQDEGARPTEVKSVRLPRSVWQQLGARAGREGMSRHAALQRAILSWLRS